MTLASIISAGILILTTIAISIILPQQTNQSLTIYELNHRLQIAPETKTETENITPLCKFNATLFVGVTETSVYQLEELKLVNLSIVQKHISIRNVTALNNAGFWIDADRTPQWMRSDGAVMPTFLRHTQVKNELKCV